MSEETLKKQRAWGDATMPLTPVERFSLMRGTEAKLETVACTMLSVPAVAAGESVVDSLRADFGAELIASEILLAVHLCDGQHNGRLVWVRSPPSPAPAGQQRTPPRSGPLAHSTAQRRGYGVGGGVC